jgi:hypothetical protein
MKGEPLPTDVTMNQQTKYASNAERQRAYRRRKRDRIDDILSMKGLPSLPAISSIPGWPRWKEGMTRIAAQMEVIESEMTDYFDERTERWQESDKAETFDQNLNTLRILIEKAQDWPE